MVSRIIRERINLYPLSFRVPRDATFSALYLIALGREKLQIFKNKTNDVTFLEGYWPGYNIFSRTKDGCLISQIHYTASNVAV